MIRYITFDIDKYLKDAKYGKWDKEIKDLEEKKKEVLPLKAFGCSEVHSGNISKTTENTALKIAEIDEKINRLESYKRQLKECVNALDPEDQILIKGYYFGKVPINIFVDRYCEENNCEKSTVYSRKIRAVENLRKIMMSIVM